MINQLINHNHAWVLKGSRSRKLRNIYHNMENSLIRGNTFSTHCYLLHCYQEVHISEVHSEDEASTFIQEEI